MPVPAPNLYPDFNTIRLSHVCLNVTDLAASRIQAFHDRWPSNQLCISVPIQILLPSRCKTYPDRSGQTVRGPRGATQRERIRESVYGHSNSRIAELAFQLQGKALARGSYLVSHVKLNRSVVADPIVCARLRTY